MTDSETTENGAPAPAQQQQQPSPSSTADAGSPPQRPAKGDRMEVSRPGAAKKDNHFVEWAVFLAAVCFAVGLWKPLRTLYYQYGYTPAEGAQQQEADAFVAIAYYGVSANVPEGSQDVSVKAFTEQLRLLRERGYTPIGLGDVQAFYKEGKRLPHKAVLMTFEQSRKSSYFDIRDILHANQWKAVMGIATAPIHAHDAQALLWPYLRNMLDMGYWDLAAQSEQGFTPIPVGPSKRSGSFFANPQWCSELERYELPQEFDARISDDHQRVIAEFERETKTKPVAFFFPYGDYGQYDEKAKVVRVLNLNQVGANYELGFTLGQLALNTRNSDMRCLNRLLIDPKWTPRQVADKLDTFWPMELGHGPSSEVCGAERWIGDWGGVSVRDAYLALRAIPAADPVTTLEQSPYSATTGAKAWLAGSDTFADGYFSVRFQLRHGHFGVYLRSAAFDEYVYVSVDTSGKVIVRQRQHDMNEMVLATDNLSGDVPVNQELL
ncbi:MAG: polysaccharide deacetylase family protein, partial [Verrucomicrobiota bacterium]|nr:polysaccharide deacetylase family protein [Verrucomicrobiota bacterium]